MSSPSAGSRRPLSPPRTAAPTRSSSYKHLPSPSTPISGSPRDHPPILHTIQQRLIERSESAGNLELAGNVDQADLIRELESDLKLSAVAGSALLEEKNVLEKQKTVVEGANLKLLDRLTASVKENAQLQRRLEQAVGNLEQADSNNRSLLVTLEEDRKSISRLTVEAARSASTATQLRDVTRLYDDAKQELASEQKRARLAESRVRKHGERVTEMEERLKKAIEDLENVRQDKVLRSRNSREALAKVKARFTGSGSGENSEAAELIKVVESLVSENDMLKAETADLHRILEVSRDEQTGLRLQIAERQNFSEDRKGGMHDDGMDSSHLPTLTPNRAASGHTTLQTELLSPSLSQYSDFDRIGPSSPASTNPTSVGLSRSTSQRREYSGRKFNNGSTSNDDVAEEDRSQLVRRRSAASAGLNGGTIPFGRGHSRRTASVDTSVSQSRFGLTPSRPVSPLPEHASPPNYPASTVSTTTSDGDENFVRRRHKPRPLSLSLGPSLFPQVPEDRASPSFRDQYKSPPTIPSSPSAVTSLGSGASGLGLASLVQEPLSTIQLANSEYDTPRAPPSIRPAFASKRSDSVDFFQSDLGRSATPASETSERDNEFVTPRGVSESRTAQLSVLIEYTGKLLMRIQSADIASQEKRLKKQNLPGNVRHLAQANLKDLLSDIDGLRGHFRRLLEQERSSAAKATPMQSDTLTESLVVRKDFVDLVKLFRDLLFETSRLRALVNRIEMEPTLATSLRELDALNVVDIELKTPSSAVNSGGYLAPFARLFSTAAPGEPESIPVQPSARLARQTSKLAGSIAVTSATVNVEFGQGVARRAVTLEAGGEGSPDLSKSTSSRISTPDVSRKTGTQVKRDLHKIFAGGKPIPVPNPDWVVLPSPTSRTPSSRVPSLNPFGRLLASYRPALTSTTYAVLDSLPHVASSDQFQEPTLLERTLRPRGLSDSSIRSTFISHANPHHRILSPATLALSSEISTPQITAIPILAINSIPKARGGEGEASGLKHQLSSLSTSTISRKQSMQRLRSKPSSNQLRTHSGSGASPGDSVIPPVPTLPISISISPSSPHFKTKIGGSQRFEVESAAQTPVGSVGMGAGSLFGGLTAWATSGRNTPYSLVIGEEQGGQVGAELAADEARERSRDVRSFSGRGGRVA